MTFPRDFAAPVVRSRRAYISIVRSVQLCLFVMAGIAAFLLRFEFSIPREMAPAMWFSVAIWLVLKAGAFQVAGLEEACGDTSPARTWSALWPRTWLRPRFPRPSF